MYFEEWKALLVASGENYRVGQKKAKLGKGGKFTLPDQGGRKRMKGREKAKPRGRRFVN